jgi:hypothetical protein
MSLRSCLCSGDIREHWPKVEADAEVAEVIGRLEVIWARHGSFTREAHSITSDREPGRTRHRHVVGERQLLHRSD